MDLADTNRALSLLRTIDGLVLNPYEELQKLCQSIADTISSHATYPLVAVLSTPLHKNYLKLMGLSAHLQTPFDFVAQPVNLDGNESWLNGIEQTLFFDIGKVSDAKVAKKIGLPVQLVSDNRAALGAQSIAVVKLLSRHRVVGLLVVGFSQDKASIPQKDRELIDRLAEVVGIALDSRLLAEENQRVLHQLKLTNEKLKALDEAKDDFVSMASHQLRTPLTSVKGYISMVLEGDAGKINDTQRKLLEQSFASSQRMVYLIADLLNVSRLKTGKFVIEKSPVNIAEVVQQEIGQLTETAAGRSLELTYKMPKKFPTIMLDETKIRQVIMNFIDNAIYYTPAGGKIKVELNQTPASIEFRVVDNGIGVPKSEQKHLFTKFYRAGNARTARPDGTGLGLFMAKKVVAAQGGAIIFETEEGKGSTFGFVFSKTPVA